MRVRAYGDRAVEILLDAPDDARTAQAIARSIDAARIANVRECVSGYGAVLAHLDDDADANPAVAAIARHLASFDVAQTIGDERSRGHVVHVIYDGPDLRDVARHSGLDADEVTRRHAARTYVVEVVGFMPGFAYLGGLDPTIATPRLPTPRPRVPAGSVAIADTRTAIYPLDSPGGWRILGRAVDVSPFDATREPPSLFRVGDRVQFVNANVNVKSNASDRAATPACPSSDGRASLTVLSVGPLATIQDRGRPGHASSAVPRGGALDPETLGRTLAAVGLPPDAAAIELPFGGARFRPSVRVGCSIDGAGTIAVEAGDELVVPRERAVRYLALDRALDVPPVLGSRSTFPTAHFGGLDGRPLRASDVVPLGELVDGSARSAIAIHDAMAGDVVLDCIATEEGEAAPAALEALGARTFHVDPRSDRVGTRFTGEPLPATARARASRPTMRGAIQLPPDGLPIVLGPDGPTTGGYPVLAVLTRPACAALARVQPRGPVRFRLVGS